MSDAIILRSPSGVINALVGKRIVKVEMNSFKTGNSHHPVSYNPTIVLEDGSKLCFHVCETDGGEYGIEPRVVRQPKPIKIGGAR